MKKTIIRFLAAASVLVAFASCERFLDTVSYTERNTSNFPASEEDAKQLVTGIYATLNLDLRDYAGTSYIMRLLDQLLQRYRPRQHGHRRT